jgi:hypothetical protein
MLDRYEKRAYSFQWQLPAASFEEALGELRSWSAERFPSANTPLDDTVSFEVTAACAWAE